MRRFCKLLIFQDTTPRNKIIFEVPEVQEDSKQYKKPQLFDEEEDEESYEIKEKYSGKNAAKLLELNSRFQNDRRFQVDERFLEDENQSRKRVNNRELENQQKERKKIRKQLENWDQDGEDRFEMEKEKQFSILDKITGANSSNFRNNQRA